MDSRSVAIAPLSAAGAECIADINVASAPRAAPPLATSLRVPAPPALLWRTGGRTAVGPGHRPRAPAVSWTRRLTRSQGGAAGRWRAQERPGRPRVWNSGAGRQLLEMPRGGAVARHGREEESHPHPGPLPAAGVQREIESCPFPRPRSGRGQCEGAIPRRCAGDLRPGSPDAIVLARSRDSGAADFFVR